MIGTAYWYLATDQWRYDTFTADTFASPPGAGRFAGLTTADLLAQSARMGWMPSYPTFNWNPLDLADALERSGQEPGRLHCRGTSVRPPQVRRPRTRTRRRTSRGC